MIFISAYGMVNALGNNLDNIAHNLSMAHAPGMTVSTQWLTDKSPLVVGTVTGELPSIPPQLVAHQSRNNRLLLAALAQIKPQVTDILATYPSSRIAVILGTSTSGLDEGDRYLNDCHQNKDNQHWHYAQQELGDPARFLSQYLGTQGPAYTISTACSSSGRAIISGARLINAGLVDAAIVGGADSLSRMPINGFDSLASLSKQRCQPFAESRQGITIGEGAGLMLLTRQPGNIALLGFGESTDAYHISAPHPEGKGAGVAINQALTAAKLDPQDIGYINLHGTATPLNDEVESSVIQHIFGETVPCSSTKHLTGHTLGSASIIEANLCALILERNLPLPYQDFTDCPQDKTLTPCGLLLNSQPLNQPRLLSTSFAFGGNNTCLIIGTVS
ncbi:beta-ketoacyl-[acyl-carrier-protein] synthase family protein [Tatumella sp. TA1]|nr:beta-ketoacyl-[acyl-carrier-protein] synthase family protein [Tatumella sp. TA1]